MNTLSIYRPRVIENALGTTLGTAFSEFDRYMDSFFGGNFLASPDRGFTGSISSRRLPAVDVRETEKTYVLEAELPALTRRILKSGSTANILPSSRKKRRKKKMKTPVPREATSFRNAGTRHFPVRSSCRTMQTLKELPHHLRTVFSRLK